MTTGTVTERRRPTSLRAPREAVAPGTTARPTRTDAPSSPHRTARPARGGRTGSRQTVSVRGRRIAATTKRPGIITLVVVVAVLCAVGVATAMYLSGKTTEQSFSIADARQRSEDLGNELESLNRDVADARSTRHIAAEASKLGMVTPGQPGVLTVDGDTVTEARPADTSKQGTVIDVNGDDRRSGVATDTGRTRVVDGRAPAQRREGRADTPRPMPPPDGP
ncbi:hypothetical protein MTQ16_08285 [Corynebacterium bovis]|uniref:hypothetical protein n=1 Tax=Corynebacterium bovis TaxID=36808 RepID=UPI003138CCB4